MIAALVGAGVLGLVIGSFLNVVIYRVPNRIPLTRESRCPQCESPVKPWQNVPVLSWLALRGRCASCRTRIPARYPFVEAITGAVFVIVVAFFLSPGTTSWFARPGEELPVTALVLVIVAYLYFAAIGIALSAIDLDTFRLPDVIVLPSYLVSLALLTAACVTGADWGALLRGVVGAAALYAVYAVIRAVRPDGMGGGDVKLAGLIGLHLGFLGWGPLAVGAFTAFVLAGGFGAVLILLSRAGRRTMIPFGPWMIAGAWVGVLAGAVLGGWYVDWAVAVATSAGRG